MLMIRNEMPIDDPARFQHLTDEDREAYAAPAVVTLTPPPTSDPIAAQKRRNWLAWRGAAYPAERHSEYLFVAADDLEAGPKILLSAVLDPSDGAEAYLAQFNGKQRHQIEGRKASNMGYMARPIRPAEHAYDIHQIIHSGDVRQGRPIARMFADRPPDHDFAEYLDCDDPNYRDICVGVFDPDGTLVAYLIGVRVGEHVQYAEIMGHRAHIDNKIMFLLHWKFVQECAGRDRPPRCLNYGPWYSGADPYSPTGGLNFWKRKTRFRPAWLVTS